MTDTPGSGPEERLPAPRPPDAPVPSETGAERFTSPPSTRSFELSPVRAAQIVRQSSNARWVGFLAIIVVILFVAIYWFYELGVPGGFTQPRLDKELDAQQVTSVERGYNVYQANCARCHGANGEGGVGPILNDQNKLYQHLNENYLHTVMLTGGRYVCGDPNSIMPVWSDQATPPGPLNYRQIQELISFIRAESENTYIVRDPELGTPEIDPLTGEEKTFKGWVDPDYLPAPDATPFPACWTDAFLTPSPSPGATTEPGATGEPGGSEPPASPGAAEPVTIVAQGVAFTTPNVTVPAGVEWQLTFDNQDANIPHDVTINDPAGGVAFKTDTFPGVETRTFTVPALDAGSYPFVCSVHANMTGTITAQ